MKIPIIEGINFLNRQAKMKITSKNSFKSIVIKWPHMPPGVRVPIATYEGPSPRLDNLTHY